MKRIGDLPIKKQKQKPESKQKQKTSVHSTVGESSECIVELRSRRDLPSSSRVGEKAMSSLGLWVPTLGCSLELELVLVFHGSPF